MEILLHLKPFRTWSAISDDEIETPEASIGGIGHGNEQRFIEEPVSRIARLIWEKQLRCQDRSARTLNSEMKMARASRIKRGHYRVEPPAPLLIGELMASEPEALVITYFGHDTVDGDDDERKRSQLFETLGRRLIITKPDADCDEFEGGEIVLSQLVVTCCDASELLGLIEEPFDEVARLVEERAEADRVLAVGLWWDVGPCLPLGYGIAQGVGIIALVGEQHRALRQFRDQVHSGSDVTHLFCREHQLDRPAFRVDKSMDFGCQPASRSTETMISIPLFAVAPC